MILGTEVFDGESALTIKRSKGKRKENISSPTAKSRSQKMTKPRSEALAKQVLLLHPFPSLLDFCIIKNSQGT